MVHARFNQGSHARFDVDHTQMLHTSILHAYEVGAHIDLVLRQFVKVSLGRALFESTARRSIRGRRCCSNNVHGQCAPYAPVVSRTHVGVRQLTRGASKT